MQKWVVKPDKKKLIYGLKEKKDRNMVLVD